MSLNGISTLAVKADRVLAKMALAQAKRQTAATPGFRTYNVYDAARRSPSTHRPWIV